MFKTLLKLFFFWRRNNAASIVFKASFFGVLAWFFVGMFTDLRTALIGGAAAAGLAAFKYLLQYRKEQAALLEMCKGDKEALAKLKKKLDKGMGGAMVLELMRAKLDEDADTGDYDEDDESGETSIVSLSEEEREENRTASQAILDRTLAILKLDPSVVIEDEAEAVAELVEEFSDGECVVDQASVLSSLLSAHAISTCLEDYCNDGDHAALVEDVARASGNAWQPRECTSSFDEEQEKWTVSFVENGEAVKWQFTQSSDWLSESFLRQLLRHVETKTDRKIVPTCTEDFFEALCIPRSVYEKLNEEELLEAA